MIRTYNQEEFLLLALRRFIAKRGEIISDNAAQFKFSKFTIDAAWQKVIKDQSVQLYISNQGIKCSFIIETRKQLYLLLQTKMKRWSGFQTILTFIKIDLVNYMEKGTKTTGIILEDLAKWLHIEPSRKVDTEAKITKDQSEWNTANWGHCSN